MRTDQSLPKLWLLSDARNDAVLEQALRRLPRGSGFVFRHYHLGREERHARFRELARIARSRRILMILAGSPSLARRWRADGSYGAPMHGTNRLVTAHSLKEIARANRAAPAAILLSPVFPTRSHADAQTLGPVRFRLLANRAFSPVVALGGMDRRRANRLGWSRWAAIDGLSNSQAADGT